MAINKFACERCEYEVFSHAEDLKDTPCKCGLYALRRKWYWRGPTTEAEFQAIYAANATEKSLLRRK